MNVKDVTGDDQETGEVLHSGQKRLKPLRSTRYVSNNNEASISSPQQQQQTLFSFPLQPQLPSTLSSSHSVDQNDDSQNVMQDALDFCNEDPEEYFRDRKRRILSQCLVLLFFIVIAILLLFMLREMQAGFTSNTILRHLKANQAAGFGGTGGFHT